jgi:type I restriction enzyme S subunit
MEKQKNIPQLRFPEFNGDWERKKLGKIVKRTAHSVDVEPDKIYYEIGIRSHGKGIFHKQEIIGKQLGKKRVFWIIENALIVNIVFAWEQAVAKTTLIEKGMIASHRFPMYVPQESMSNIDYLLYFFLTPKGKSLLELASPGGAGRNKTLGQNEFLKLSFQIPSTLEQQKIASFFTAIDLKITQLKHKKDLLEHYKKGVMQKIFSQEIRFKDDNGQEYPKWEKKKLRDVATKKSSNISANKIEKNIGDYIIYGAAGILRNINFYEEENDYISIVKDGAGVGRLMYCKGKSSVLGTMEIIKPLSKINTYYLYCLLSNIDFAKYVIGSTIPHIYFKDYSHEICSIPDLSEQTKIANFLSAIDDKINNTQKQIEKAEVWKKGLMQQMFV